MQTNKPLPLIPMALIVLLALAINLPGLFLPPFAAGLQGTLPFLPDEAAYHRLALLIHDHGWLAYFASPHSLDTMPLWPSLLALMLHLPSPFFWMRLFSEICLALSVGGLFWLGDRLGGRRVGFGAAALYLLFRPIHDFGHTILTEPLFILLFILTVIALVIAMQERRRDMFWVAAGLLLLATFVRPVVQLLPLFLMAFLVWHGWRKREIMFWAKSALPFAMVLVLLAGYGVRNALVFDKPGLCNGSGAALWLGSRPDTEGDEPPYRGQKYAIESVTRGLSHVSVEGDRLLAAAAKANIQQHFPAYVGWSIKRIGRLLIGNRYYWQASPDAVFSLSFAAPLGTYLATVLILLLKLGIVLLGLWLLIARFRTSEVAVVGVVSGYFILMHMPVLVNSRYGLPLIALLCAPAALGLREMLRLPRLLRWQTVTVCGAVTFGVLGYQVDIQHWAHLVSGYMREAPLVTVDLRGVSPSEVQIEAKGSRAVSGKATSQDPQLLIPLSTTTSIRRIRFELEVKNPTVLQVFYAKDAEGFDEARSIRVPVTPERKHYTVDLGIRSYIDQADVLRVDPVADRHSFNLSNLQLN